MFILSLILTLTLFVVNLITTATDFSPIALFSTVSLMILFWGQISHNVKESQTKAKKSVEKSDEYIRNLESRVITLQYETDNLNAIVEEQHKAATSTPITTPLASVKNKKKVSKVKLPKLEKTPRKTNRKV